MFFVLQTLDHFSHLVLQSYQHVVVVLPACTYSGRQVVEVSLVKIRNKNIEIRNKSEIQISKCTKQKIFCGLKFFRF